MQHGTLATTPKKLLLKTIPSATASKLAGKYIVKLTIDGESTTRTVFISDIVPRSPSEIEGGGLLEVNTTFVKLDVELPEPIKSLRRI